MRVLFVSQELPPETGWGGIGTYVDVLSEALAAKGVEVHVLSVVERAAGEHHEAGGVTVHRLPLPPVRGVRPAATRRLAADPGSRSRLPGWSRGFGLEPDVVECPEWMAEGLGARAARRRFR